MPQEYTIKRITRQNKVSKSSGKPYESIGLQLAEFGAEWINGFGNQETNSWKEGDVIAVVIEDNVYNGKTTKQFKLQKRATTGTNTQFETIIHYLKENQRALLEIGGMLKTKQTDYPKAEGEPPF